jgi:hypothetical protein
MCLPIESEISPVRDRAFVGHAYDEAALLEMLERRDAVTRTPVPQWAPIAAVRERTPRPWIALHAARAGRSARDCVLFLSLVVAATGPRDVGAVLGRPSRQAE